MTANGRFGGWQLGLVAALGGCLLALAALGYGSAAWQIVQYATGASMICSAGLFWFWTRSAQ
jgi:hypothetical protein